MPQDLTDDKPTLVQIMTWCCQAKKTITGTRVDQYLHMASLDPNELTHGNKDHWYTGMHQLVATVEMTYHLANQPLGDFNEILDKRSSI